MGCQWTAMAKDLMGFDIIRESLIKSSEVIKEFGLDLMKILTDENHNMDNIFDAFLSIISIQIALIDLFKEIDIIPDGFIGHSFGEFACAYCDGCIDRKQALTLAYWRSKLLTDHKQISGRMAVIGMSWDECVKRCPEGVFAACHNSQDSVTISGERLAVTEFLAQLNSEDIVTKDVDSVDFAFHSPFVSSISSLILYKFKDILSQTKFRSTKWISTSVPECDWNSDLGRSCSAHYLENNFVSPVLFHSALKHVPRNAIVVEMGPHAKFKKMIVENVGQDIQYIPLMKRNNNEGNVNMILSAIGRLYQLGLNPDISKLYPRVSYPVSRGTQSISSLIKWDHSDNWFVAKYPKYFKPNKYKIVIDVKNDDAFYLNHRIDGKIIFPAMGYIVIIWRLLSEINNKAMDDLNIEIDYFRIHQPKLLGSDCELVEFTIQFLNDEFSINDMNIILCTGKASVKDSLNFYSRYLREEIHNYQNRIILNSNEFYKEARIKGYDYGQQFQCIDSINSLGTRSLVKFNGNYITFFDSILQIFISSHNDGKLHLPIEFVHFKLSPRTIKNLLSLSFVNSYVQVYHNPKINLIYIDDCLEINYRTRVVGRSTGEKPLNECYKFKPYIEISKNPSNFNKIQLSRLILDECEFCLQIISENNNYSHDKNILYFSEQTNKLRKGMKTLMEKYFINTNFKLCAITQTCRDNLCGDNSNLIILDMVKIRDIIICQLERVLDENGFILAIVDEISLNYFERWLNINCDECKSCQTREPSLVLIRKRKVNQFFSIILMRKTRVKYFSEQIYIKIKTNSYHWLDLLKKELENIESRPIGVNVLLMSNELTYNGVIGLVNSLRKEPNGHRIRCLLFDRHSNPNIVSVINEILRKDLIMNVICDGKWGSFWYQKRRNNYNTLSTHNMYAYLTCAKLGDLSTLKWCQMNSYLDNYLSRDLNIDVYYCALNFRDIMIATGRLAVDALPGVQPLDSCPLGLEFAGRDSDGRRIMAMVGSRGLATNVIMKSKDFLWPIPDNWSMEQASTVPVAYCTAFYALVIRGRLKCGETVLIHSGSGAVGQAAIRIVLNYKCKVFTTVGNEEKRKLILKMFPTLTEDCLANSRDTSFEYHILKETMSRGVDVVLNSLAEDKLQASVRCLAQHGRFLEIGKFDLSQNNNLGKIL